MGVDLIETCIIVCESSMPGECWSPCQQQFLLKMQVQQLHLAMLLMSPWLRRMLPRQQAFQRPALTKPGTSDHIWVSAFWHSTANCLRGQSQHPRSSSECVRREISNKLDCLLISYHDWNIFMLCELIIRPQARDVSELTMTANPELFCTVGVLIAKLSFLSLS